MNVCDRHEKDLVPSTDRIWITSTDEKFDLCNSCLAEVKAVIKKPVKRAKKDKKESKN